MSHPLAFGIRLTNPAINGTIGNFTTANQAGSALSIMIQNLLNVTIGFIGLFLLIMLIRGGYGYITAGGDKEALQKSIKTMTAALIGAAILLSMFAIMRIVETLFGINLRSPVIPTL